MIFLHFLITRCCNTLHYHYITDTEECRNEGGGQDSTETLADDGENEQASTCDSRR